MSTAPSAEASFMVRVLRAITAALLILGTAAAVVATLSSPVGVFALLLMLFCAVVFLASLPGNSRSQHWARRVFESRLGRAPLAPLGLLARAVFRDSVLYDGALPGWRRKERKRLESYIAARYGIPPADQPRWLLEREGDDGRVNLLPGARARALAIALMKLENERRCGLAEVRGRQQVRLLRLRRQDRRHSRVVEVSAFREGPGPDRLPDYMSQNRAPMRGRSRAARCGTSRSGGSRRSTSRAGPSSDDDGEADPPRSEPRRDHHHLGPLRLPLTGGRS